MKKVIVLAIGVLFLISSSAFAEEHKGSTMGKGMMSEKGMMMKSGKMMGMCPMHKMMKKEMVPTEDGGVIVMVGNKLLKYDKDLNLKKESEIKMDIEGMQSMMEEMMEKCPMRKMMMKKCMVMGDEEKETKETAGSDMPAEHDTHH